MNEDDGSWWLLDSGASTMVMSAKHLGLYKARCEESYDGSLYRAANVTAVDMHGQTEVCAWVALHDWRTGYVKHRRARLRALVADIRSNIISTTTLCSAGWKFVQDKDRFEVVDAQSGEVAADVASFAGCPWTKNFSRIGGCSHVLILVVVNTCHTCLMYMMVIYRVTDSHVLLRRLYKNIACKDTYLMIQDCTICARGKSVFHHRRRRANMLETEIQADFCVFSRQEVKW